MVDEEQKSQLLEKVFPSSLLSGVSWHNAWYNLDTILGTTKKPNSVGIKQGTAALPGFQHNYLQSTKLEEVVWTRVWDYTL